LEDADEKRSALGPVIHPLAGTEEVGEILHAHPICWQLLRE
jgi:hypothetical protein